jgi:hypothetical protein
MGEGTTALVLSKKMVYICPHAKSPANAGLFADH